MDKAWKEELASEAQRLGLAPSAAQIEALSGHVDLLLKWNAKVNLTRITAPREVLAKHVLDSLAALQVVPAEARTALDLGTGAGFPGVPWLVARPGLQVTLVDSVAKKVAFLKTVLAQLRLRGGRAVHVRLEGQPEREGLAPADVVVSRAFTHLGEFLRLARPYLAPGGAAVALLARREGEQEAAAIAGDAGFELVGQAVFSLPYGLGERRVIRAVPRGTG